MIMAIHDFPYIDRCRDGISSIDPVALSESRLSTPLGNGSTYSMFGAGYVTTDGLAIGCKLQRRGNKAPVTRFIEEIGTMAVIASNNEEILTALPQALGVLVVQDSPLRALIVEDTSVNGLYAVEGVDMSSANRALIESAVGGADVLIVDYRDYMAFLVNGRERILDGEPSPFVRSPKGVTSIREAVQQSLTDFTVTIPTHSPLAVSMQAPSWL